jgi:hypothetical protein
VGGFGSVEILFSVVYFFYFSYYEGDPPSPPEGEEAQGEQPLGLRFFINLLRASAVLGDARAAGADARSGKIPKERLHGYLKGFNRAGFLEKKNSDKLFF